MRGKGELLKLHEGHTGITPACAGKSREPQTGSRCRRDHPRVCGEKPMGFWVCRPIEGSPPRVRGKAAGTAARNARFRITPACAGKSGCPDLAHWAERDHPRVCGEKNGGRSGAFPAWGSPPRVRGKVVLLLYVRFFERITPACAGKSLERSMPITVAKDHPRVCGEKGPSSYTSCCPSGSPPRVRGKEDIGAELRKKGGITPACAGKSPAHAGKSSRPRDHPRVCGEKSHRPFSSPFSLGSPPRVRGKATSAAIIRALYGITPACAGKSYAADFCVVLWWDHPRVCGEKKV